MANRNAPLWRALRRPPAPADWIRFAGGGCAPARLGRHLSALANSARLAGKPAGYAVFGVDRRTGEIRGTDFNPHRAKGKLLRRLAEDLQPHTRVQVEVLRHPDGRVVVFRVESARDRPVAFRNSEFVRLGASTIALDRVPQKARAIWTTGYDWSGEVCEEASLSDLDPVAIREARHRFAVRQPARAAAAAGQDDATFLDRVFLTRRGAITVAALVLVGRRESRVLLWPNRDCGIHLTVRDSAGRRRRRERIGPPLLFAGQRLLRSLRDGAARFAVAPPDRYDAWVLREALNNAIVHQDYSRGGRIAVTQHADSLSFANHGRFLPEDMDRALGGHPPLSYDNPFLARAMAELGLIAAVGHGLLRILDARRGRGFAPPAYDLSRENEIRIDIPANTLTPPEDGRDAPGRRDRLGQ